MRVVSLSRGKECPVPTEYLGRSVRIIINAILMNQVVSESFRTGHLERELQMVQLPLGAAVSLFCESV